MLSRRLLRLKVVKALYASVQAHSDDTKSARKNLAASIDKTYELFFRMSLLVVAVARYAEERQEIARNKKLPTREDLNPNRKFVENEVVRRLAEDETLSAFAESHGQVWAEYPETVRNIYNNLVETDFYKAYMANPERSFKEDLQLVTDFYSQGLDENEMLEDTLEEQSILWSDDLGFALIMVVRMLSSMRERQTAIKIPPKFKSGEDLDFALDLLEKSVLQFERNRDLVDRLAGNWDVERIAFMDVIIMAAALTELREFPSIPVKVTLDEYIEISKFYSTPNSSIFINGILDKAVEQLTADGEICKSGRGLI
ncbi:MAG: transcription antitermination protein NusB [Alistipes sp.]|nr:transcription antitermination protein NusB [Alistipes sp.]